MVAASSVPIAAAPTTAQVSGWPLAPRFCGFQHWLLANTRTFNSATDGGTGGGIPAALPCPLIQRLAAQTAARPRPTGQRSGKPPRSPWARTGTAIRAASFQRAVVPSDKTRTICFCVFTFSETWRRRPAFQRCAPASRWLLPCRACRSKKVSSGCHNALMPTFRWLPPRWTTAHPALQPLAMTMVRAHHIVVGEPPNAGEDWRRGIVAAIAAGFAPSSSGGPKQSQNLGPFSARVPGSSLNVSFTTIWRERHRGAWRRCFRRRWALATPFPAARSCVIPCPKADSGRQNVRFTTTGHLGTVEVFTANRACWALRCWHGLCKLRGGNTERG